MWERAEGACGSTVETFVWCVCVIMPEIEVWLVWACESVYDVLEVVAYTMTWEM